MKKSIAFNLNGQAVTLDIEPDTPLLWVIREQFQLTGSKFGCGKGLCGACTVHLDGQPVRSCSYPVGLVADKRITTIEGVAASAEVLHPVQDVWASENVPQCGYCQSGQIMAAIALLERNPEPNDDDIAQAMSNICRCGTYPRIKTAIHKAAARMRSDSVVGYYQPAEGQS